MPKSWNDYAKKATTAETGGDFPDIDDENWRVRIVSRRNADSTISINLRKVPR